MTQALEPATLSEDREDAADDRPGWLVFVLLPLLHFASVRLSFYCAVTADNEVVVWLPNAVLLAALLRYRARRGWLMALLTFSSDMIGNLPEFPWQESVLLSMVNVFEVVSTYLIMRRARTSLKLERVRDFVKFLLAGPLISASLAGILAAIVMTIFEARTTSFLTLARLWWFGDGLGLLIYTPLLLAFAYRDEEAVRLEPIDGLVGLITVGLAGLVYLPRWREVGGLPPTPTLLLPSVLYVAARLNVRWTALAVALVSLATSWALTSGHGADLTPDLDAASYLAVTNAQEFILTLAIVGFGFAVLLRELRASERDLEAKVHERTAALEESNRKLATLSTTDELTGLANRRRFDDVLAHEWSRAQRSGEPLALVLLDVDLFKSYNDRYGHLMGDECLRQVARVLQAQCKRGIDLVARYGGEEFAFIAPSTDEAGARQLADAACEAVRAAAIPHQDSPFKVVTASFGVAVGRPSDGEHPEAFVGRADGALYRAKGQGRNLVVAATEPIAAGDSTAGGA